jgi:hypothetical protein
MSRILLTYLPTYLAFVSPTYLPILPTYLPSFCIPDISPPITYLPIYCFFTLKVCISTYLHLPAFYPYIPLITYPPSFFSLRKYVDLRIYINLLFIIPTYVRRYTRSFFLPLTYIYNIRIYISPICTSSDCAYFIPPSKSIY